MTLLLIAPNLTTSSILSISSGAFRRPLQLYSSPITFASKTSSLLSITHANRFYFDPFIIPISILHPSKGHSGHLTSVEGFRPSSA
ncbi:hypothetical protein TGAM01_v204440 [Trichoderma gamsii]|uniref:Uncharacterized protein n=1 Tax=Trichoderma gamsii TaxID=398673 RepID=A0A2P4ZRL2_9HYPO|nr:hypothetical protein TGAM01_v204440 [Trichoderma gamsii]PON26939.1 hypothetical protein TGAM01_v204440 [Trichoderma gamsii]